MNTNDHSLGPCWINEGSKDVEDCAEGEGFADGSQGGHSGVVEGGEEEGEWSGRGEDLGEGGWGEGQGAREGEEEVGGTGCRG
jgi:hypothetical protein